MTATVDASASVVNTYRAKPYGGRLAKTGTGADPVYEFTGDTGSRRTGLAYAEQFNRARHLGTRQGAWTTASRTFGNLAVYIYTSGSPTTMVPSQDQTGNTSSYPQVLGCKGCGTNSDTSGTLQKGIDTLCSSLNDPKKSGALLKCIAGCNKKTGRKVDPDCLKKFCGDSSVFVRCRDCAPSGKFYSCPKGCKNTDVLLPNCGETSPCTGNEDFSKRQITICCNATDANIEKECCCAGTGTPPLRGHCDGSANQMNTLFHELVHVCQKDCALDDILKDQQRNNDWAACVIKNCLKL